MTELERTPNSIVQIKIGSRVVDAVFEPRCQVCNHPARFTIEEKILLNNSYPQISRWISDVRKQKPTGEWEAWYEIESKNIKTHFKRGHCPLDSEMMRSFAEKRAEELGLDLESSYSQFTDHVVIQKAVASIGYEALVKGEIKPDVKDTLAAAKLLADREKELSGNASTEEWQDFMALYFTAVKGVVSAEQWEQIVTVIKHHPAMKAMDARRAIEAN